MTWKHYSYVRKWKYSDTGFKSAMAGRTDILRIFSDIQPDLPFL
jgi:hypothetical protein